MNARVLILLVQTMYVSMATAGCPAASYISLILS
jgi:hypothetical protein